MALIEHTANGTTIYHKVMFASPSGTKIAIGVAFRSTDAPIGYLPFFGPNDFDFSGKTSFKEEVMARSPINLSAAGSPHTLLLKVAAGDVEFLGSGDEDLIDIQQLVKKDLLRYAMNCASGVFVDGIMMALGGPTIKTLVRQLVKSKVKQFVVSTSISSAMKKHLKEQGSFDCDKLLVNAP